MSKQITDFNEAVDYVFDHLYDSAKLEIKHTSKSDLICYHLLLGQVVRNNLILWGNPELLQSADCSHPDKASHKIVVAVWERAYRALTTPNLPNRVQNRLTQTGMLQRRSIGKVF